jgi:hypothetical protein
MSHDALLGEIQARSSEEYARASDAAESGAKLKEFLEETNLNSQAFSWLKAIWKKMPKKDGQQKALDVIRSLEAGLPMLKAHIQGQSTMEMDLDDDPQSIPVGEHNEEDDIADEAEAFEAHADTVVKPVDFAAAE